MLRSARRSARPGRGNSPAAPPTPAPKQAVMYARVSSREQEREGFSIPAQQTLLRKYATDNGYAIVAEYTDVETAKRTGRTAFTQMLAALKKKGEKAPVILVEKTDRLYRNLKDWVALDELRVDIHLIKEGIVLSDESRSSEKFIHGIKVLMAKNYVDNLSEEVKKGMYQKCEDGYYPGKAPIGYINHRENGRARLVTDPERALLVRNLFDLYDRGEHSIEGLTEYAAKTGLRGRSGGVISTSIIHSMLRNPLYAGRFHWGGQEYDSKEPTLITRALWERVQARLDGHPYTRANTHEFAFSGMMTCGHCGSAITAEIKKAKYVYYHCGRRCQREKFLSEAAISDLYLAHVRQLRMPPELRVAVTEVLKGSQREIEADVRTRIGAATARMDRLGKLINAAYEDKLAGTIDADFFNAKRAGWERDRAEAAEEIQRLAHAASRSMDVAIQVFELANRAYDLLKAQEPRNQRQLLEVLFSNSVLAEGRLTPTWVNPFDILANWRDPQNGDEGDSLGGNRPHSVWSG